MPIGAPKDLIKCRQFFLEPSNARHRMYEALRAYFLGECSSQEAAERFGYSVKTFRVMCHHFRRDLDPQFFLKFDQGPKDQPKKSVARQLIVSLRKKNYSVYEISETLKEQGKPLSPTGVREVLKTEGFRALPRRLDEERPPKPRMTVEPVADVRPFHLEPRTFNTQCGGLFLFMADLVALDLENMAQKTNLPGSKMIPSGHALRASLALKLWSLERKSHVMSLVTDEGLALFSGLNVTPKRSFLAEYSSKIDPRKIPELLADWSSHLIEDDLFPGKSFNLDFHSVPYYGEGSIIERHYVSARSRRQKSILAFLAQDADAKAFCYSNANIRKGEEADEIFRFIRFWEQVHGEKPEHLVFDSRLTTYKNLALLKEMGITFITLRRRSPKILKEIALLPRTAWRQIDLDIPTRKYRTPRVYEQSVILEKQQFRQLYILNLGHDEATVLLTNDSDRSLKKLITRYAKRMLIENALSDAVRFFHMDALSSAVGMKVDFDMALLVIASVLYRRLAQKMRGYSDAQARQIFRDIIDTPADVKIENSEVTVRLHRRAHLPIIIASGLLNNTVRIPWWQGSALRILS